jgi:transposase-like protein
MDLIEIFKKFKTQEDCIMHLEKIRWGNIPTCPYCNSKKSHKNNGENRYFCHTCKTSYCVTVRTIFHNTKLPLQKWFLAVCLIVNAKKGISSRQLGRDINVTKDTAWRVQMQIREAMSETPRLMCGIVEMDETYIGGRSKKNKDTSILKRGRGTNKTPVVGIVERGGKVIAKKHKRLRFQDLKYTAERSIDFANTILMTDDFKGYTPFKGIIKKHETITHSTKKYANDNKHTNTIEGFWSLLKRGITGQYHWLSDKWLNQYIQEFCFKYNNRSNANIFALLIEKAVIL